MSLSVKFIPRQLSEIEIEVTSMGRLLRVVSIVACFFSAGMVFAQGGACPTTANYLNSTTGSLVTLASLGVKSCFYFSKSSGSDGNAGTSESSPQAHLPGMPSYTGKIKPAAGEGFILKGGDTWVASDLDLWWQWAGTSGAPIYIGVDPSWYSGSSWTRPIFTCGGASCTYTDNGSGFYSDWSGVQYVTVDNLEVTGLYEGCSSNPNYFSIYGSNNTFERIYAHGWSHAAESCGASDGSAVFSPSQCCSGGVNNVFHDNVIDGSDTSKDMMEGFGQSSTVVYNNVIRYIANGILGASNDIHSNYIGPIVLCYTTGGCHQNGIENEGPASGNYILIYNNVITGVPSGGAAKLWVGQGSGNSSSTVSYVFNNVMFNNVTGNDVNIGQEESNLGTVNIFNNTFECDTGPCTGGMTASGVTMTVNWINNHCITSSSFCINQPGGVVTVNIATSLNQTVAKANSQGYTQGSTYAWQPTSATASTVATGTVAAGTNEQSLCTTLAGINAAAGAACQYDTGYVCSYKTSNHTVSCPARQPIPRLSSWNIGAYQFASGSGNPPPAANVQTIAKPN